MLKEIWNAVRSNASGTVIVLFVIAISLLILAA